MLVPRDSSWLTRIWPNPVISEYWTWLGPFLVVNWLLPWGPEGHGWAYAVGFLLAVTTAAVIVNALIELGRRSPGSSKYPDAVPPYPFAQLTLRSLFKTTLVLSIFFSVVARLSLPARGRVVWTLLACLAVLGYYVCGELVRRFSRTNQLPK